MAFECRLLGVVRLSIIGRFVFLESAIFRRFVWDFSEIWICGLYTEQNPWDEGDESYNHQTSVLSGDMKVAMIAENSIASGAGIAVVDGVEIPTVDQLGNARPATPSVGAVEYSSLSGITGNVKDVVRIWNNGNIVYATGLDKAATAKVYSMTGGLVYEGIIANHSALELPIEEGVYLIVVDKAIQKLIIK